MQTFNDKGSVRLRTTLRITPLQLEQLAKRLRDAEAIAIPGQQISYDLTNEVEILYDPAVSLSQFSNRRFSPELKAAAGETLLLADRA